MIVIVSGLPRSGTSLMMQCLQAGGLPIHIGKECRKPDIDNPKGYFEPVDANKLVNLNLRSMNKIGIKILFPWIMDYDVNEHGHALIIWMSRSVKEMAASQRDMCLHRNLDVYFQKAMIEACHQKLDQWVRWRDKKRKAGYPIIEVGHRALLSKPLETCLDINIWLRTNSNEEISLSPKMADAVEPLLYRQREEWIK